MTTEIEKKIFGYNELFNFFIKLDLADKIPNKFIISGKKGIGKSTFTHHLINYLFSKNEPNKYDVNNYEISNLNKSYNLVKNNTHPNFFLINSDEGKEQISIDKVRKSFDFINRSSLNNDYRIVLINNAEYLNINSSNALLKIIEEPNDKLIFILIHNTPHKLLETIKSRCIIFKKSFTENENISIYEKLTNTKFDQSFDDNLLAKFMSVGDLIYLKNFSEEIKYTEKINSKNFLSFYFKSKKKFEKKDFSILLKLMQIFLYQKNLYSFNENNFLWYTSFFKKISEAKKFNLDIENIFLEFQLKNLND